MKKNIYFLAGMLSFGALFTGCDDDDFGKAVTITVENATNLESDVFGVDVTEGQPVQLKPFIMPESARENAVSYHFAGEPSGAIEALFHPCRTFLRVDPVAAEHSPFYCVTDVLKFLTCKRRSVKINHVFPLYFLFFMVFLH